MAKARIKICGLRDERSFDAAIGCGIDFAGLVFFPASPRAVDMASAAALAAHSGTRIARVGLFVDADDALIADAVVAGQLDALQLHGRETPERTASVRARYGLPVWKALPVASADDVRRADAYRGAADLILFDAKTPRGTLPGGMGLSFDWSLLAAWHAALPWGLAGGIGIENVGRAITETGAPLVDTSSGVETAPGVKDPELIKRFAKAVRET